MATPARMRRMTAPPGDDATAAPLGPAMKAPEAATRPDAGPVVATGLPVVDVPPWVVAVVAAADELVVEASPAGAPPVAEVELSATAAVDVDDSARLSASEPREQAVADNARMSNRTRRFTGAHHRTSPTRL
jgi:hypothetical protein